jgi:uncharacterized protein (TIGR03118 family)
MILTRRAWTLVAAVCTAGAVVTGMAGPAAATGADGHDRDNGFIQTNLVSNIPGLAAHTDPNLRNPWGISTAPGLPLWVSDNGTGLSTLYDGAGNPAPSPTPLVVTIPPAPAADSTTGTPTGTVFNTTGQGFPVTAAGVSAPSRFLFATEDGALAGWNPKVDPTRAVITVDRSTVTDRAGDVGAVYKGLALASTPAGRFLFATNFRFGQVEVFDTNFTLVRTFTDPHLPSGYAPFGIQNINGRLFVTFAKQDAEKHDDVSGPGNGFVDVFSTRGAMLQRLASRGPLNSPWALTQAPATTPGVGGDILVGNFGDGRINAYSGRDDNTPSDDNPSRGGARFIGALRDTNGKPISIPGLWDLTFPTGSLNVPANTLYFTAGINGESDGLLGTLTATR